jgi:hypothetical protein
MRSWFRERFKKRERHSVSSTSAVKPAVTDAEHKSDTSTRVNNAVPASSSLSLALTPSRMLQLARLGLANAGSPAVMATAAAKARRWPIRTWPTRRRAGSEAARVVRDLECLRDDSGLGLDAVVPNQLLGEGSYGSVWSLAPASAAFSGQDDDAEEKQRQNANGKQWILKVSNLDGDASRTEQFDREVYFLRRLQGTGLVPELKMARVCGGQGLQLMERFDGSFQELGVKQGAKWGLHTKHEVAVTQEQIDAVVDLVLKFDKYGILHGDLKRGNILESGGGKRVVLADFGFTGARDSPYHPLLGFVNNYACPTRTTREDGATKLRQPIPRAIAPYLNRLEIYTDFVGGRQTFIIPPNSDLVSSSRKKKRHLRKLDPKRLAKALQVPQSVLAEFRRYCPDAP